MTPLMKPLFDPRRWPRKAGLWGGVTAGVVSVVLLVWIAVPYSVVVLIAAVPPRVWSGVRVWLVPPYLFIAIHLMIVVIWKLSEHKARAGHRLEDEKPPAPPPEVPVADKPRAVAGKVSPVEDPVEFEPATPAAVPESGGSVPEPSPDASRPTTESDATSTASSRVEIRKSVEVPTPSVESPAEEDDDESLEARWKAIKAADTAPVVRSPRPDAEAAPPPAKGLEPGPEEMNRRYDAFIQKNYDQRADPVPAVHGHG